jgi:small-conductance mechanosensitive channel
MDETQASGLPSAEEVALEAISDSLPTVVEWLPKPLLPAWEIVAQTPALGALIIATSFVALALIVRLALFQGLAQIARWTHSELDDRILEEFRKPIFVTLLYGGLALAVGAARLPFGSALLINSLASIIVASWMRATIKITNALLELFERQERFSIVEARTLPLFDLTSKLLTILFGSYALLLIWGINPVGWLASAGIVGIAVGFAAKDTLANLFSGFFIVADSPYKIGDYINLDTGERGRISAIGLRSTRLITRDDVEVTIPNGVIAAAKIVNESGGPHLKMRSRIAVGVAYGSDIDQVCEVLHGVAETHPETCSQPTPRVRMRAFGASSLDFELLFWIEHPEDRGRLVHELLIEIYKAFAREGIEIPYAKNDVFIKEMPGAHAEGE